MEGVLICVPMFYFIYSIICRLIRNKNTRNILRIYADQGLLNADSEFKFNFNEDCKNQKSTILPVALGIMGISLGLFLAFILRISAMDPDSDIYSYRQWELVQFSLPLFFGALGLLVSYFVERKDKNNSSFSNHSN